MTAHQPVTGPVVLASFRAAVAGHGVPASTLTDNGLVYTDRFAGGRGGRNGLEHELRRLGVRQKNGKPEPPPDPGQDRTVLADPEEMARRPAPPSPPTSPSCSSCSTPSPPTTTPAPAPLPAPPGHPGHRLRRPAQSHPGDRAADTHHRVRTDRVDADGKLTLRHAGRLHHIGIGRTHARTPVLMLVRDLHIRIVNAATGELLRELTLDPTRNYQPTGRPPGPPPGTPRKRRNPEPIKGSGRSRCPETSQWRARRDSNPQPSDP